MSILSKFRGPRFLDLLIAGALFLTTLAILVATPDMGFTRDEGFYFHAASLYIGWFEELWIHLQAGDLWASFTQENIDRHWSYNREHPVVMKAAFALSHKLFHETLGWMSPTTALRFPAMLTASSLVSGVFLFGRRLIDGDNLGRVAGLVAAAALFLQPRFFFHAHLAVFDVPMAAIWFWVVYAYWRSYESRGWALMTGLLFGLALSVKLNAFFLPIVLLGHWALAHWRDFGISRSAQGPRLVLPALPKAFWSMLILGPLLFYALWPRHWFDTFARLRWYMQFHLKHEHYMVAYFGENLQIPPFPITYPTVMTLVTVPATILLAAILGGYFYLQGFRERKRNQAPSPADRRGTGLLLVINIVFPIALISMPDTPIFGGTKHWMPAMPFLALFAGYGLAAILKGLSPSLQRRFPRRGPALMWLMGIVLAVAVLAPAAYATAYNHPHGTSYYNVLIGSYRGAADRGMFRQFWGYSSRHALPYVNEVAEENAPIWTHNTISYAWRAYQDEGLARSDLRATSISRSDLALYHQQKAFIYHLLPLWASYGTRAPAHVVSIDGVPLLSVYTRPDREDLKYPDIMR